MRRVQLFPHARANVGEEISRSVRSSSVKRLLLYQAGEASAAQQVIQDTILRVADSAERADRLNASQDFRIDGPHRRREGVLVQKLHCVDLMCPGQRGEY